MEISTAALLVLILAAAFGPPAHGSPAPVGVMMEIPDRILVGQGGVHRPTDCCSSYTHRNIRCVFMESYYQTSSECPLPAVVFKTKRGQEVCADPNNGRVQECMKKLVSENTLGKWLLEEKLQ